MTGDASTCRTTKRDASRGVTLKYVTIDEHAGTVLWDRYFEYLRSVEQLFPAELYAYAINWDHYSLESVESLHDAWLTSAQFGYREREVTLEFLGSFHDRTQVFKYTGVKSHAFGMLTEYWLGDGDVLAQEFRLEDNCIVHEIMFANHRGILITADNVSIQTRALPSAPI
jgi:hypothetical protein